MSNLEPNPKISLQIVAEECEQLENLQHDMARIEERDISKINAIKQKQHKEKFAREINPCYGCGQIHYYKECPFRREECFNCGQKRSQVYTLQKAKKIRGGKNLKKK